MADITRQEIRDTPITIGATAVVTPGGNFTNNAGDLVVLDNRNASSSVFTFVKVKSTLDVPGYGLLTLANIVATVLTDTVQVISIPTTAFNDGNGQVAYSASNYGSSDVFMDVIAAKSV